MVGASSRVAIVIVARPASLRSALDLVSKPAEVLVQPIEDFAFGRVGGEIADPRGLGGISAQLLDGRLIILHARPVLVQRIMAAGVTHLTG
jgi:hypothetical protein